MLSGLAVFSKEFAALGYRLLVLIVRCAVGCICLLPKNYLLSVVEYLLADGCWVSLLVVLVGSWSAGVSSQMLFID